MNQASDVRPRLFDAFHRMDALAKRFIVAGALLACLVVGYAIFARGKDDPNIAPFEAPDVGDKPSACLTAAREKYEASWAESCVSVARQRQSRLTGCLTDRSVMTNPYMGKSYCDKAFGGIDPSPQCALPAAMGKTIKQSYEEARSKC
jgi:hypothetical protein